MRMIIVLSAMMLGVGGDALACAPLGMDKNARETLKAASFAIEKPGERERFALALVDCLGEPDPAMRDGFAFAGLSSMLRAEALDAEQKRALMTALFKSLDAPADEAGVRKPFVALALSEVARADRVAAFLTDQERAQMVARASDYLATVSDYRGFDEREGWRHGVAHGADWLMQLALNPAVDRSGLERIVSAVAKQAAPSGHSYIFGEGERLARPILFAARRTEMAGFDWNAFASALVDPAPMKDWNEAFGSQAALAQLHNLKAFFGTLYIATATTDDGSLSPLKDVSLEALKRLP